MDDAALICPKMHQKYENSAKKWKLTIIKKSAT